MTVGDLTARLLTGVSRILADVPPIEPPVQRTALLPLAVAGLAIAGGVVTALALRRRARRGPGDQA